MRSKPICRYQPVIFQLLYKTPTRKAQPLDDPYLVRVIGDVGRECHQRTYAMQIGLDCIELKRQFNHTIRRMRSGLIGHEPIDIVPDREHFQVEIAKVLIVAAVAVFVSSTSETKVTSTPM